MALRKIYFPYICALGVAYAVACGGGTHVFRGRLYRDDRDCVATTSSIDVVDGADDPGVCAPLCLVQRAFDGGRPVYVSTMCAPYPFDFDTTGSDPRCAPALAAYHRNDTCLSDGGSTAPIPRDGSSD